MRARAAEFLFRSRKVTVADGAILNDLHAGNEIAEPRMARLLSLFWLEFRDRAAMRLDVAGRPIYLGMAMTADNVLRLEPQNLPVNLPLAATA